MLRPRFVARLLTLLTVGWMIAVDVPSGHVRAAPSQAAPAVSPAASPYGTLLKTYCVGCHNERMKGSSAGLALDTVDVANPAGDPEIWEKVIRKLRFNAMPPPGRPRPDKGATGAFVSFLTTEIDRAATLKPNPGRIESTHRLNRAEYKNAIRDLLGVDFDVASMLPADDSGKEGFDNTARMLSVSPLLLERYLATARKVSRLAVGIAPGGASTVTYRGPLYEAEDELSNSSEDLPFGSRGGFAARHHFPVDGEYDFSVRLRRSDYDYIVGLAEAHRLDVRVDGRLVKSFRVGGEAKGTPAPLSFAGNLPGDTEWEQYNLRLDESLRFRVAVTAGPHVVGVSFVSRPTKAEGVKQRPETAIHISVYNNPYGNPVAESITIDGPYNAAGALDTPSRRRVFVCRPTNSADEEACAKRILSTLARRAYRRQVTDREVESLLSFYRSGRSEGTFDDGVELAIERVLVDPNFLFRIEADPPGVTATPYRITDLELASRLSFFLWSGIPDDELLDLAIRGRLREPGVLTQQVRRMFADTRSRALVENFAGQWLQVRDVAGAMPNKRLYPEFDELLRRAFRQETELFIESTMREDRSVLELFSSNYTFVNERLARHYQIPDIYGERFRRVAVSGDRRGGLLSHGSMLLVTSYPNRTSPVLRGKWVLENVLGNPPPPPPPNVPGLPDRGEGNKAASVRERLEQHRKTPACATCHSQIDPLGFALENFDAVGKWRTTDAGSPVDAKAAFPTGAEFEGLAGLRAFVLSNREAVVHTIIHKLLAYALGRELEFYDLPIVRHIQQGAASSDYRWSSIIVGIVSSTPFQMRTPSSQEAKVSASASGSRR